MREDMDTDWGIIRKLMQVYSPDLFNLDFCTEDLYRRCAAFVTTRCFGWGLPSSIVAPIADCFNHYPTCPNTMDIINKNIHLRCLKERALGQAELEAYIYTIDWENYTQGEPF